jgi:ribosomal-protein-alanine N-acetyltransferase
MIKRQGMPDSDFQIGPMKESDLLEIVRLERTCFSDPWSLRAFRDEIRPDKEGGYPRVLRMDGKVVGYSIAWFVADEVHLANLAVAPERRGQGLASALLYDLLHEGRRRESRVVWLEVRVGNAAAIRLYERFQFRPVAVRKNYYAREHEDALVMLRVLEPEREGSGGAVRKQEERDGGPDQKGHPRRNLGQMP